MASATETLDAPVAPQSKAWQPSAGGWALRMGILAGLLLLIIWATATVSDVWASRIALAAIYAIIGLSLNIIMGYVGQVSLGHHAFVGLAAFMSAFMVTTKGQSFGVGVLVACAFGGMTAGLLGLVALRIKGLYLALITLTYGFVAVNSFFEIPALTGGGQGLEAPRPSIATGDAAFAYLCFAFLAVVLFVDWRFLSSKVGRAVLAVKESEAVASSYAVNVTAYKVMAFVLSGVFAGLAGSLFAHRNTVVVATDFQFTTALTWVLMVVVGGLGNRVGVVIGSAFFALFSDLIQLIGPLEHWLENTFRRAPDEFELLIGSVLALLTIILHPGGISDQVAPLVRWFGGKKFSLHGDEGHGVTGATSPGAQKGGGLLKKLRSSSDAPAENATAESTPSAATQDGASAEASGLSAALEHASGSSHADGEAADTNASAPDQGATAEIPAASEETAQVPAAATKPKKKTTRRKTTKKSTGGGEA